MNVNKKKDISETEKGLKNIESNDFFDGNHLYVYLYKKAEKLASALYMVTNFISETEILRNLLREKSINVFSGIMQLQKMSLMNRKPSESINGEFTSLDFILSNITEIVSFLGIANVSGYVSEMNFSILKREYIKLGNLIKNRKEDIVSGNVRLPEDFFDVPDLYEMHALKRGLLKDNKFIKDTKDIVKDNKIIPSAIKSIGQKDHKTKTLKDNTIKDTFNIKEKQSNIHTKTAYLKHNNRRNIILELLQNRPFITVTEVTNVIDGCSSKTLQRELLSLVNEGILIKKGKRRWSAYSLA